MSGRDKHETADSTAFVRVLAAGVALSDRRPWPVRWPPDCGSPTQGRGPPAARPARAGGGTDPASRRLGGVRTPVGGPTRRSGAIASATSTPSWKSVTRRGVTGGTVGSRSRDPYRCLAPSRPPHSARRLRCARPQQPPTSPRPGRARLEHRQAGVTAHRRASPRVRTAMRWRDPTDPTHPAAVLGRSRRRRLGGSTVKRAPRPLPRTGRDHVTSVGHVPDTSSTQHPKAAYLPSADTDGGQGHTTPTRSDGRAHRPQRRRARMSDGRHTDAQPSSRALRQYAQPSTLAPRGAPRRTPGLTGRRRANRAQVFSGASTGGQASCAS